MSETEPFTLEFNSALGVNTFAGIWESSSATVTIPNPDIIEESEKHKEPSKFLGNIEK